MAKERTSVGMRGQRVRVRSCNATKGRKHGRRLLFLCGNQGLTFTARFFLRFVFVHPAQALFNSTPGVQG